MDKIDPAKSEKGFELAMANKRTVRRAVNRFGLRVTDPDFEDFMQEGFILYAAFYSVYKGEATPEKDLETFNNLAVRYLYRAFVDRARNTTLRQARETMKYEQRVDVVDSRDEVERHVMLDVLYKSLTPREKPVFELVYLQDLSIDEAAEKLGKTRHYVWQVRKEIHEHHQVPDFIDRKRGPMVI